MAGIAAVFGLAVGSFLNVVIYRVPRGLSIVRPPSACPGCGVEIRPRDNVPLLSYVLLRGRCRACGARISPEYPVVELLTALLFVGSALVLPSAWQFGYVIPFLAVLVACAFIDLHDRIIPNRIVLPAMVFYAAAALVLDLTGRPLSVVDGLIGFAAYGGALFLVALVSGGMGMGDVKLAALIGLVLGALGLRYVGVAAMLGIVAGGVGAVVALAMGRDRKAAIPFGPYLALGAALAILTGPAVSDWYLGLFR
jgi:leader peptidase (prepilin peptidase) / N-methyltransferase